MLRFRLISFTGIIILFFLNTFEIKASERLFSIAKDTFENIFSIPSLNATGLKSDSKDTTEFIGKRAPKEEFRKSTVKPIYNNSGFDTTIYESAEINPEPSSGFSAFRKWISDNYQYPQEALGAGTKGTIELIFIVEKDGSLTNIKVLRDLSYGTGQAAIDLMKRAKRWFPGIQEGRPVRTIYRLPIKIDLSQEKWVPKEDSREAVVKPAYNYSESDSSIYESAEINPEPPGGMIAFRKWISENYQYPQEAIDARVEGTIEVFFVVEKDGSLTNIKVLSDLSHGTGQAAINLMKRAKKWSPGINNGRPVRAAYKIPFRIDLINM